MGKIELMAAILFTAMIVGVDSHRGNSHILWVDHNGYAQGRPITHPQDGRHHAVPFMRGGDIYILTDNGSVFVYYTQDNIYKVINGSRVRIRHKDFNVSYLCTRWVKKINEDTLVYAIDGRSPIYMVTFTGDSCACVEFRKDRGEYWHDGNMLFTASLLVGGCWSYSRGKDTIEFDLSGRNPLDVRHGMLLCWRGDGRGDINLHVIEIQTRQKIWKYKWDRETDILDAIFASDNTIIAYVRWWAKRTFTCMCINMIDNTVYHMC